MQVSLHNDLVFQRPSRGVFFALFLGPLVPSFLRVVFRSQLGKLQLAYEAMRSQNKVLEQELAQVKAGSPALFTMELIEQNQAVTKIASFLEKVGYTLPNTPVNQDQPQYRYLNEFIRFKNNVQELYNLAHLESLDWSEEDMINEGW